MNTDRVRDFDDHEWADAGVYVLLGEVNGLIACKVGMSSFVQNRIYQVCQTSPFELTHSFILSANCRANAATAERALHGMLRKYRTRGEWFMFDPLCAEDKAALHTAVNTVAALHAMPKVSIAVEDIRSAVKFWQSEIREMRKAERHERKKRGAQYAKMQREKRAAEKADRYARRSEFEEHHARQRAAMLAARTFSE